MSRYSVLISAVNDDFKLKYYLPLCPDNNGDKGESNANPESNINVENNNRHKCHNPNGLKINIIFIQLLSEKADKKGVNSDQVSNQKNELLSPYLKKGLNSYL